MVQSLAVISKLMQAFPDHVRKMTNVWKDGHALGCSE
jgi:hypothetical protein